MDERLDMRTLDLLCKKNNWRKPPAQDCTLRLFSGCMSQCFKKIGGRYFWTFFYFLYTFALKINFTWIIANFFKQKLRLFWRFFQHRAYVAMCDLMSQLTDWSFEKWNCQLEWQWKSISNAVDWDGLTWLEKPNRIKLRSPSQTTTRKNICRKMQQEWICLEPKPFVSIHHLLIFKHNFKHLLADAAAAQCSSFQKMEID